MRVQVVADVQPADTLLSQINKGHGPKGSMIYRLGALGKEAGFRGLFAGLGPRMSKSSFRQSQCALTRSHDCWSGQLAIHHVWLDQERLGCATGHRNSQGRVDWKIIELSMYNARCIDCLDDPCGSRDVRDVSHGGENEDRTTPLCPSGRGRLHLITPHLLLGLSCTHFTLNPALFIQHVERDGH